MSSKLYVFLEGNDDERFFVHVIFPLLIQKNLNPQVIPYAQEPAKKTKKFIRAIKSSGDQYIFVKDINNAPCVTASKSKAVRQYNVDLSRVFVVVQEIECWYLCGLNDECCRRVGIQATFSGTQNMTKEDFDKLVPTDLGRIEFMQQILEKHDIVIGKGKNPSFAYFLRKLTESSILDE